MTRVTHPEGTPPMPWFKGSSDLSGEYGDMFYGTTKRSKNVLVKNGAATHTRRGIERNFDAQYQGNASLMSRRTGSSRYVLLGDGEGVHALTSMPSSKYAGIGVGNSGFARDYFNRANGGGLSTSGPGSYWLEGKNSDEVAGWTASDSSSIASNMCRFTKSVATTGTIDWSNQAPTEFYFSNWQMDFSGLTLGTTGHQTDLFFFQNLPAERINIQTGAVLRERMYAIDAWNTWVAGGVSICWSGLAVRLRLEKQGGADNFRLQISMGEFVSSKDSSEGDEANAGRVENDIAEKWTTTTFSEAQLQGRWLLSFGREREASGRWKVSASLWRSETITGSYLKVNLDRDTADANVSRGNREEDQGPGFSGYYRSAPGGGGYAGAVVQFKDGTGTIDVEATDISLENLA